MCETPAISIDPIVRVVAALGETAPSDIGLGQQRDHLGAVGDRPFARFREVARFRQEPPAPPTSAPSKVGAPASVFRPLKSHSRSSAPVCENP